MARTPSLASAPVRTPARRLTPAPVRIPARRLTPAPVRIPARRLTPAPVRIPARRLTPAPVRNPARRVIPVPVRMPITRPRHHETDTPLKRQLRQLRRLWRGHLAAEMRRDRNYIAGDRAGVARASADLARIGHELDAVELLIADLDAEGAA